MAIPTGDPFYVHASNLRKLMYYFGLVLDQIQRFVE